MQRRRTRLYEWPRWETPRKQSKPHNGGQAREEHFTVWKDGHEKTAEWNPDVILSLKAQRRQGRLVKRWRDDINEFIRKQRRHNNPKATNLRDGWQLQRTPATGTNWKMYSVCAATEPYETSTASTLQRLPLQQPLQQSPHDSPTVTLLCRRTTLKFHNTFMTWRRTTLKTFMTESDEGSNRWAQVLGGKTENQTD